MDLSSLHGYVSRRRGRTADPVTSDDILQAIKKLGVLGGGIGIVKVGGHKLVSSVPHQLNTDTNAIMELAQVRLPEYEKVWRVWGAPA